MKYEAESQDPSSSGDAAPSEADWETTANAAYDAPPAAVPAPTVAADGSIRQALSSYDLDVPLTDAEIAARAATAVSEWLAADQARVELKAVGDEIRERIKEHEGTARTAMRAHTSGVESRKVDCVQVFNIKARKTWVEYGGYSFNERPMDDWEVTRAQQRGVFDKDQGAKDVAAEAAVAPAKAKRARKGTADAVVAEAEATGKPIHDVDISGVYLEEKQPRRKKDHCA